MHIKVLVACYMVVMATDSPECEAAKKKLFYVALTWGCICAQL